MPEIDNLLELINKNNNFLILLSELSSLSDVSDLHVITTLLHSQNKKYQIVSLKKVKQKIKPVLEQNNIEILSEIKPSEYTITIDYGSSKVEKIVYDTDAERGKLIFKILPSKGGFDFNKVEFNEGGEQFDGIICIGIPNPKDLGDIYDKYENLFRENMYFLITDFKDILPMISKISANLPIETVNKFLQSALNKINLIEGSPEKEDLLNVLNFVLNGGDISTAIFNKYYQKPEKILSLMKLIFANLEKIKEQGVVFSYVTGVDMNADELAHMGRIPFNIIKDYNLAFLFVEISENEIYTIIESNDVEKYSALTIAGIYNGFGDKGHAECVLDFGKNELDKRFFSIIKDLYNIDVTISKTTSVVDNSAKKLTKSRKYSKNKGLRK